MRNIRTLDTLGRTWWLDRQSNEHITWTQDSAHALRMTIIEAHVIVGILESHPYSKGVGHYHAVEV